MNVISKVMKIHNNEFTKITFKNKSFSPDFLFFTTRNNFVFRIIRGFLYNWLLSSAKKSEFMLIPDSTPSTIMFAIFSKSDSIIFPSRSTRLIWTSNLFSRNFMAFWSCSRCIATPVTPKNFPVLSVILLSKKIVSLSEDISSFSTTKSRSLFFDKNLVYHLSISFDSGEIIFF